MARNFQSQQEDNKKSWDKQHGRSLLVFFFSWGHKNEQMKDELEIFLIDRG